MNLFETTINFLDDWEVADVRHRGDEDAILLEMSEIWRVPAHVVAFAHHLGFISGHTLGRWVPTIWSDSPDPLSLLNADIWRELFDDAGYTYKGRRRGKRTTPIRLYVGDTPHPDQQWSWCPDPAMSTWTVVAPPEAILAVIGGTDPFDTEYICDPAHLPTPSLIGATNAVA